METDCWVCKLSKKDAIDRQSRWRKLMKDVWWTWCVWMGKCFIWYRPTRVVLDKGPLTSHVHMCAFYKTIMWRTISPIWKLYKTIHGGCRETDKALVHVKCFKVFITTSQKAEIKAKYSYPEYLNKWQQLQCKLSSFFEWFIKIVWEQLASMLNNDQPTTSTESFRSYSLKHDAFEELWQQNDKNNATRCR